MALTSITIPCRARDASEFDRLLSYWSDPRLWPIRFSDREKPIPLCVVLNRGSDESAVKFKSIFLEHRSLHQIFSDCLVFDARLEGDRDLYVRGASEAKGLFGNKAGPNLLFFEAMRLVHSLGGFTFQNEVDCYPLHAGWLSDLRELIDQRRFAWVIGSMYTGQHPVGREIQYHLNGNAIYQSGSRDFIRFLATVWKPRLFEFVNIDPNIAYDCWWAIEMTRASSALNNTSWAIVSKYAQFFCVSQFLINLLSHDFAEVDVNQALRTSLVSAQPALFLHGHSAAPLMAEFIKSEAMHFEEFLNNRYFCRTGNGTEFTYEKEIAGESSDSGVERPVIHMLGSPASQANPPRSQHTAITVGQLPVRIAVRDVPSSAFIGNWYVDSVSDHIWTGGAASALHFILRAPKKYVRISLRGAFAPGLSVGSVTFAAYGPKHVDVSALGDGSARFDVRDPEGVAAVTITINAASTTRVKGDERELAYVLYNVEITELKGPELG